MNSNLWMSIDEIRSKLVKSPLFPNRYIGVFSGNSVFDDKIGYMMSSVSMPTFTYNSKEQYVGGVNTVVTNIFQQGQIDITIYNTGKEYDQIHRWAEQHYNQKTKCYGYMKDIYASLSIYEYNRAADIVLKHMFTKCNLYTYGGIQLTYDEPTGMETFQATIQFREYELEYEG